MSSEPLPPLKALHPDETLSKPKLIVFERMSTEALTQTLLPNQPDSLKVRPDGTILDGHHRQDSKRPRRGRRLFAARGRLPRGSLRHNEGVTDEYAT